MIEDLSTLSVTELRRRRDHVREWEEQLSYRRRLLQAQLDIVESIGGLHEADDIAERLGVVLADGPTPAGQARSVAVDVPNDLSMPAMPEDVSSLDDEERAELRERLIATERETSQLRRSLLDELDQLQAELVRRYRTDGVDARELLGGGA